MEYEALTSYLFSLKHHGAKYGIDRMPLLVERLGHPERQFPIIHVAGTNGKGTTCAMLEAIYRANGYKTGLFTSPHLVKVEERIQISREMISRQEIIHYIEYLKEIGKELGEKGPDDHPSFFEMINAMAFLHFAKSKVDIGIIETGLGGEKDSTNVVDPLVSVITSISRDHTAILGDTIEEIAQAKGGIIKPGKPVVLGPMLKEAEEVLRQMSAEKGSKVYSVEEEFGSDFTNYPQTNLQGSCQRKNAATALLTARVLREEFSIEEDVAKEALKNVDWPGRWERVTVGARQVILDCSHNEAGAEVLEENLSKLVSDEGEKPDIVVGLLGEYKAKQIIPVVAKYANSLILVRPKHERGVAVEFLEEAIPASFNGEVVCGKVEEIFSNTMREGPTLVAVGSIYLVGEIKECLN